MEEPMKITAIPLSDLTPDPANARTHDARNVKAIADSLAAFGQYKPIVVQRSSMRIIAGNGTYDAAASIDWPAINCHVIDVTDEQATAIGIADNRSAELANWDDAVLTGLMGALDPTLQALTGFNEAEIEGMTSVFSVPEGEFPDLPDGDRAPIQGMKFTVHDDQVAVIMAALTKAKAAGEFGDTGNANSNGNALARISEAYNGQG